MEIHQKTSVPNNQKLKTMVKRCTDQKLLLRSFDARHWRIESGAVVRRRKGIIGVEGGKGLLPVERKRPVFVRRPLQFSATTPKIVRKNQTPFTRSKRVEEEKYPRQKFPWVHSSTTGQILFERYLHANVLWILASRPSANFFFKKKETGCKEGDKCLFPHYKVDEQPNKKPKKEQHPKKKRQGRQERCACCEKRITIGLRITRLGCTRVSRNEGVLGENPMQKVLEPIQRVRFTKSTLRQASIREKKGPSLGKINVKVPHQRSPYVLKIWGQVTWRGPERQQRCAQSKAWDLAKKYFICIKIQAKSFSQQKRPAVSEVSSSTHEGQSFGHWVGETKLRDREVFEEDASVLDYLEQEHLWTSPLGTESITWNAESWSSPSLVHFLACPRRWRSCQSPASRCVGLSADRNECCWACTVLSCALVPCWNTRMPRWWCTTSPCASLPFA